MFQISIALVVIIVFMLRLLWQKRKNQITKNEFIFWFSFWLVSAVVIIFIKKIDSLVSTLGFSGSGIQILLYFSVATLFYFIFRVRLRIERLEQNLTKLIEKDAQANFNKKY